MVQLSEKRIEEYRQIFKEEYGRELTKQEAFEAAHNLVGFFDLLLKIGVYVALGYNKKD